MLALSLSIVDVLMQSIKSVGTTDSDCRKMAKKFVSLGS